MIKRTMHMKYYSQKVLLMSIKSNRCTDNKAELGKICENGNSLFCQLSWADEFPN